MGGPGAPVRKLEACATGTGVVRTERPEGTMRKASQKVFRIPFPLRRNAAVAPQSLTPDPFFSFLAQGDHRIHFRGAAGGKIAR